MPAPTPYIHFPGTAREALTFYGDVFGGAVQLHTYAEFNRSDGPGDAVAHGMLVDGPVALFGADVSGDDLGAGPETEAEADAFEMSLSRAFVDPEPVADLTVGESLGDQGGHLLLPSGQSRRVDPASGPAGA